MKFGGLSEKEVQKISAILTQEGIDFTVDKDQEIEEFNKGSMKNNLRHYTPPNISTHILAITIEDEHFSKISESSKIKLMDFGISDQVPSAEDFQPFTGETIHNDLLKGQNRVVAFNLKHQLILGAILLGLFYFFKNG